MSEDLALAERAARAAGGVLLERYGGPVEGLDVKSSATDPVSDADREAERTIRELLEAERPYDGLLGEEGSREASDSGRRWVIDPLDGTVNYLYGIPQWCVSIALEDADGALAGVVFDPLQDELFSAERGSGAGLNGKQVSVSGVSELSGALVGTGFSYEAEHRAEQAAVVGRLLPLVRDIRRAGSAALDLCWVATGRLDGFYERGVKPWDWRAGGLLVEEAGGEVRELPGEPFGVVAAGPGLIDDLFGLVGQRS
ncbi:MAG TPA: inositol monophosphatase family protein [Thermoleophilaceae bacterium]|nr:inositol monophosphatase family protein [Thermoleophilaceae bacterium]